MSNSFRVQSDTLPGAAKLAEECNETAQVLMKIVGGDNSAKTWKHLEEEIADTIAAIAFFQQHNSTNETSISKRVAMKLERWNARRTVRRSRRKTSVTITRL
jgi:NTP pyrophosphatase (non-canonical NTP hydrolase)